MITKISSLEFSAVIDLMRAGLRDFSFYRQYWYDDGFYALLRYRRLDQVGLFDDLMPSDVLANDWVVVFATSIDEAKK